MRGRTARKVFLRASRDWTGHKPTTLAKAARKVLKKHVPTKDAGTVFTLMWAIERWPDLQGMFEGWLSPSTCCLGDHMKEFLKR